MHPNTTRKSRILIHWAKNLLFPASLILKTRSVTMIAFIKSSDIKKAGCEEASVPKIRKSTTRQRVITIMQM